MYVYLFEFNEYYAVLYLRLLTNDITKLKIEMVNNMVNNISLLNKAPTLYQSSNRYDFFGFFSFFIIFHICICLFKRSCVLFIDQIPYALSTRINLEN